MCLNIVIIAMRFKDFHLTTSSTGINTKQMCNCTCWQSLWTITWSTQALILLRDIRHYLRLQLQDPVLRTDNQHCFMTKAERHSKVHLLSRPGMIQPLTSIHPQDTSIQQHHHHRPHLHMRPIHRPDTALHTMAEHPHHRSNLSSSSSSKWWWSMAGRLTRSCIINPRRSSDR